jgi:hypothetical protein
MQVKYTSSYDTWGIPTEASRLAGDLHARASRYDIIVVVTVDAYINDGFLTDDAKNALAAVGGFSLSEPTKIAASRANAAFIGVVPADTSNIGFNYLVSVMPADSPGFGNRQLAALPFAWGLYSTVYRRFLLGGAANNSDATGVVPAPPIAGPGIIGVRPGLGIFTRLQPTDPVVRIPGIGAAEREVLSRSSIANIGDLANTNPVHLATILNIQPSEAETFVSNARTLLEQ